MADDDNFDIDIYGDETAQDDQPAAQSNQEGYGNGEEQATSGFAVDTQYDETLGSGGADGQTQASVSGAADEMKSSQNPDPQQQQQQQQQQQPQQYSSETAATPTSTMVGTKRKTYDGRNVDPNATMSTVISELHWWHTEDDVRGWCAKAEVEDDIKDITFNEHKVNGKSKGQVFLEFSSPQAATAFKSYVDNLASEKQDQKLPKVEFYHGPNNPYKTLPKDVQSRRDNRDTSRGSFTQNSGGYTGNYRGRGNNFNNFGGSRGGMNRGGFNQGGGAAGAGGGANYQQQMPSMGMPNMNMAGFGGMNMPGFNPPFRGNAHMMGGMRGGMQNRGGRGGMGGGPMMNPMASMGMGMPMGGMPMGGNMMGAGSKC
jgi:hypothetical protein